MLAQEAVGAVAGLAPALVTLRGSQAAVWHAVEHKSIAAYEAGGADEVANAADHAKEHDRCGSNLVVPLLVTTTIGNTVARKLFGAARARRARGGRRAQHRRGRRDLRLLGAPARAPALARHPRRWATRCSRASPPREPSPGDLLVGQAAMEALLRAEAADAPGLTGGGERLGDGGRPGGARRRPGSAGPTSPAGRTGTRSASRPRSTGRWRPARALDAAPAPPARPRLLHAARAHDRRAEREIVWEARGLGLRAPTRTALSPEPDGTRVTIDADAPRSHGLRLPDERDRPHPGSNLRRHARRPQRQRPRVRSAPDRLGRRRDLARRARRSRPPTWRCCPTTAPVDESTQFTVRVPTERDVPTTGVRVVFPAQITVYSFAEPPPGWRMTPLRRPDGRYRGVVYSGGPIPSAATPTSTCWARPSRRARPLWPAARRTPTARSSRGPGRRSSRGRRRPRAARPTRARRRSCRSASRGRPPRPTTVVSDGDDDGSGAAIWLGVIAIGISLLAAAGGRLPLVHAPRAPARGRRRVTDDRHAAPQARPLRPSSCPSSACATATTATRTSPSRAACWSTTTTTRTC